MGALYIFVVLALLLAIATTAILIAAKRIRNGWIPWLATPIVAFLWYWVLVCFYMGYYMWQVSGVRG